ncbi:obr1 [Symbiodinium sp. CCMP2456]|nr:obr1 [Symbiodinium sp. CCMP2456]
MKSERAEAVISSGSAYHNCLGIEQLDKLLNQVDGSTRDVGALESLKKALRSKGGARNQARAVGSLLFSTAMNMFDDILGNHVGARGISRVLEEGRDSSLDQASVDWVLDEVFDPPKQFISSQSFPPEATAAIRSGPRPDSELLGSIACGAVVLATGTCGNYIQCNVAETLGRGRTGLGFVLRQLDGLPLFSPAPPTQQTLDESFDPVKIFVCAPSFPKTSSAAVRAAPTPDSELVTTLPFGSEVQATARAGSYLQIRLADSAAAEGGSRLAWVPRLLGDLVLFVEQEKVKPTDAERSPASLSTEAAICEQTTQISRFQQWWADGHGDAAAAAHSILSLVDRSVLQDVVSAGANYHSCLSADRLDGLQRMVDKSRRPGLEALRRALLTKGGAKSQARAVGTVLFKEALTIFNSPKHDAGNQPTEGMGDLPGAEVDKTPIDDNHREIMLDEIYNPPKRFVCSDAFPKDATVAVRAVPDMEGELLTSLPSGAELLATGSRNSYLQFRLEDAAAQSGLRLAWVPRLLGDLVLFVEQEEVKPTDAERSPASLSTEAAICEQTTQISRFQQWWADGHGDAAAAAHSILSLVDRSVLQDVVSAGANYHSCLSADRLDGLQRMVDKSRRPGLEALRRALLTKGGAKSQARAVGTVLFKEALTIFNSPKHDAGNQPTEGMGDLPGAEVDKTAIDDHHREIMLDEIYNPPKRFVCSDAFPKDATVAVRAAPTQQSEFLTCLPFGAEIIASGRCGQFLRFQLQEDSECRDAYVPLVIQGLQLFVPQICGASVAPTEGSRVADLERRVAVQEQVIQGLQAELCSLRAHMSARSSGKQQ